MNNFDFDFSFNIEDVVIEPTLPAGKYFAIIDDVYANDRGALIFKIIITEDEKGNTEFAGWRITDYKSFSPNARKYSIEGIKRMAQSVYGPEIANKLSFRTVDDYRETFVNKNVKISIKHENVNGEIVPRVGFYIPRYANDNLVLANIQARNEFLAEKSYTQNKKYAKNEEASCPF